MTGKEHEMDDDFSALLAGSKIEAPDALMSRVLADGLDALPAPGGVTVAPWWQRLGAVLGGWQSVGGLTAAACAGFWIGVAPPEMLPDRALSFLGADAAYESPDAVDQGFGWDFEEEDGVNG